MGQGLAQSKQSTASQIQVNNNDEIRVIDEKEQIKMQGPSDAYVDPEISIQDRITQMKTLNQ